MLSVAPPANENPVEGFSIPDFAGIDSEFSEVNPKPEEGWEIKVDLTDFSSSSFLLVEDDDDDPKAKPEVVLVLVETA